jgi:hypothetical protein
MSQLETKKIEHKDGDIVNDMVYHEYVTITGKEPKPALTFFQTKRFLYLGYAIAAIAGVLVYLGLTLL